MAQQEQVESAALSRTTSSTSLADSIDPFHDSRQAQFNTSTTTISTANIEDPFNDAGRIKNASLSFFINTMLPPSNYPRSRATSLLSTSPSPTVSLSLINCTTGSFVPSLPASPIESLKSLGFTATKPSWQKQRRPSHGRSMSVQVVPLHPIERKRERADSLMMVKTAIGTFCSRTIRASGYTSVPSLSRTQSPSPPPTFPSSSTDSSPTLLSPPSSPFQKLHEGLARPERRSRLKSRIMCNACGKEGDDFPRCPRCGVAWCSRECRIEYDEMGEKRRHICRS